MCGLRAAPCRRGSRIGEGRIDARAVFAAVVSTGLIVVALRVAFARWPSLRVVARASSLAERALRSRLTVARDTALTPTEQAPVASTVGRGGARNAGLLDTGAAVAAVLPRAALKLLVGWSLGGTARQHDRGQDNYDRRTDNCAGGAENRSFHGELRGNRRPNHCSSRRQICSPRRTGSSRTRQTCRTGPCRS